MGFGAVDPCACHGERDVDLPIEEDGDGSCLREAEFEVGGRLYCKACYRARVRLGLIQVPNESMVRLTTASR